jgi:putative salt-induced outer membrane protein
MNRFQMRRWVSTGAVLGAALWSATALAQGAFPQRLAPPPPRNVVPDDGAWRGTLGSAFSFASGNRTTSAALLNASAVRATIDDRITVSAALDYGRSRGPDGVSSTTAHRWFNTAEYDWNLSPVWFISQRGIAEANRVVRLNLRALVAQSVGYKIIDQGDLSLSLYGGLAYMTERWGEPKTIGGRTDTRFDRFSLYLSEESRHRFGENVTLSQRLEVYPGITGDKAVLGRFASNLGVAMTRTLQINVGLIHTVNTKPPLGLNKSDTSLFTGISLRFGPE